MNRSRCNPPKTEAEIRKIAYDVGQFPIGKLIFETPPPERAAKGSKRVAPQAAPAPPTETLIPPVVVASVVKPTARSDHWHLNLIRRKPTATEEKHEVKPATLDKAALANAITALRQAPEWEGVLAYNEFTVGTAALKPPPWPDSSVGDWTDQEDRLTADWLQHQGIMASVDVTGHAVQAVARDASFHPVREYLDSLKWDGTHRIDQWLNVYLGVEQTAYSLAVGARWLISGVARIYQPGAKVDCCLILEGPQGSLKSTALRTLAGDWFSDELADIGSKDSELQLRGIWIIEMGELDSMNRSEASRIKVFMSRSTDNFRPPYGKRAIPSPRQCIFSGSVNHSEYLRDETGGRRFWPVACGTIHVPELQQDRNQLWAESVVRYRSGSPWWLETADLEERAQQEQADRFQDDPWAGLILPWLRGRESASIPEVLTSCIEKRKDLWTQSDRNRVAAIFTRLRWDRYNSRTGPKTREWRYRMASE
jgi:predicted P-loop ATPase